MRPQVTLEPAFRFNDPGNFLSVWPRRNGVCDRKEDPSPGVVRAGLGPARRSVGECCPSMLTLNTRFRVGPSPIIQARFGGQNGEAGDG
jgi:hypothetical protein